jgi:poly-gamma-glutamate synthesis protein (capsule biosynthesis protein)
MCAVGDLGLSGRAAATARNGGADRLFADVRCTLRAADIAIGNLESPLAGDIAPGGHFSAPATGAQLLAAAGFNLVHVANNHIGEYGQEGLAATLQALQSAGVQPLGAGDGPAGARQLIRTDRNGLRVGWLGCGRTLLPQSGNGTHYWEFNEQELLARVIEARPAVDVLIVSIHIGLMYVAYPRPEHKLMAERLMEAGADVILMHHAHVLQGTQVDGHGRVCCYNLGNFLYDWEEGNVKVPVALDEQNESGIFVFDIDRRGVSSFALLPTWIDDACCVRWATGQRGQEILNRFERISRDLESDYSDAFERQRAMRNTGGIVKVLAFHARRGNWRYIGESLRRTRWEHIKMAARWMSNRGGTA